MATAHNISTITGFIEVRCIGFVELSARLKWVKLVEEARVMSSWNCFALIVVDLNCLGISCYYDLSCYSSYCLHFSLWGYLDFYD